MSTLIQAANMLLQLMTLSLLLVFASNPAQEPGRVGSHPTSERPPFPLLTTYSIGLVVGLNATLPLWDTPERQVIRTEIPIGALVEVEERLSISNQVWYRVMALDSGLEGWLPSSQVRPRPRAQPYIGNVRFCAGSRMGPDPSCREMPTSQDEGLWVNWNYVDLQPGNLVQRVLVVNDERYSTPPEVWSGPRSGRVLINLQEHSAMLVPGRWSIWFIVDGVRVNETSWHVK